MLSSHYSYTCRKKVTVSKLVLSISVCLCLFYVILVSKRQLGYQDEIHILANNSINPFYVNDFKDGKQIQAFENRTGVQYETNNSIISEYDSLQFDNIKVPTKGKKEHHGNLKDTKAKKWIKIVVYFPFQKRITDEIRNLKMNKCQDDNCYVEQLFVEMNGTIVDADAIVIQGNKMPKLLPARKDAEQVFVFLNNEPPLYSQKTNLNTNAFNNYFNWTMTYKRDSDIPLLYGAIIHRQKRFEEMLNTIMKTKEPYKIDANTTGETNYSYIFRYKNKNAFWLVSHCLTESKRENYIHQMKTFTEIDQFGRCNKKPMRSKAKVQMSKQYKFYLSFENTFCVDYITEKVFNWFASDIVLVVRGGCDYSKILPEGTYIDANKFLTPVELAKYLTKLGQNEREYLKFLKKKDEYYVIKELEMVQSAFCNLCQRLKNRDAYRKSVANVYKWWQLDSCWEPMDI